MSYVSRAGRRPQDKAFTRAAHFGGGRSGGRSGGNRRGPKKDFIHPSRFVKEAKSVTAEEYVSTHTFQDFAMDPLILANIEARGFVTPSPIQDQTIPLGLDGRDVIGIANTGTGKTLAFAVPVIHHLMRNPAAKALIVAPTRELAQQIEEECRLTGKGSRLTGALLIGGAGMGPQLRDLRYKPRIVVGTPGRIMDHMQRGTLSLNDFSIVVLDEVDRMLDMGFVDDVTVILGELLPQRQSFFFSATMDDRVGGLIRKFANDPVSVSVKTGETSDSVHQDIVCYDSKENKLDQLHNILVKPDIKAIVFDETQRSVERLSNELKARGFKVDDIHGGKTQGQRNRALSRFKRNEINILVATDVAARGIDVADITHVINYSQPQTYDAYIHRIGRAGRAGRIGHALTFVTDRPY